jgi:hypothetical protein
MTRSIVIARKKKGIIKAVIGMNAKGKGILDAFLTL